MVSVLTIISIFVFLLISLGFPLFLLIYYRKKYKISFKVVFIGILTFIVFVLFLENLLHLFVIKNKLIPQGWAFAVYGALAAGIFEEGGRYIFMRLFLKDNKEYKDGLAFGIGHGGFESLYIGMLGSVSLLIYSFLIKRHKFQTLINKTPKVQDVLIKIQSDLTHNPAYYYLLAGLERIMALTMQIIFSLLVLFSVRTKKIKYLFYAVILHALFDFGPALYQMHILGIKVTEFFIFLLFLLSLMFIENMKILFSHTNITKQEK